MAKKKSIKAKEPVKIRFKEVKGGNKSLYLDIYQDGQRAYKFLKLYLVPETTEAARIQNANTLQAANAIKAQIIIELANSEAGIKYNPVKGKMLLTEWLGIYQEGREKKGKRIGAIVPNLKKTLIAYRGDKITLNNVDKHFCMGFMDFLENTYITQYGRTLSRTTSHAYCSMFSTILRAAVVAGIIPVNPFSLIPNGDRIKPVESKREYLTPEELQTLMATPFPDKGITRVVGSDVYGGRDIKAAFLFSCFTGLRLSDIKELKWSDIVESDGQMRIDGIIVKKTRRRIYLPLGEMAVSYLPQRPGNGPETVFNLPNSDGYTDMKIREWARAANMSKKITFHTARHTFATLELTAGADLYTVSKLLGHSTVSTTQIYAKIVNSKRVEAVNKLDGLFK